MSTPDRQQICQNCEWWKAGEHDYGECRRHTPTVYSVEHTIIRDYKPTTVTSPHSGWPNTTPADWCGEFARKHS